MATRYLKKPYPLYLILIVVVFVMAIAVVSINISYLYNTTKNEFIRDIKYNSHTTISRLKESVTPYVQSYSIAEYEKLLDEEMRTQDIFAIVIKDYNSGKIFGKEHYITGKIRGEEWEVINYIPTKSNDDLLGSAYYFEGAVIKNDAQQTIAKIDIYSTDRFLDERLRDVMWHGLTRFIAISLILVGVLYFFINKLVLQPINQIINTLLKQDTHGVPLENLPEKGSKEIVILAKNINQMIASVKESNSKLTNLNSNLEKIVDRRTAQLRQTNIKFFTIFNDSLDPILILNYDTGKFDEVNPQACKFYGYTKREFEELTAVDLDAIFDEKSIREYQRNILIRGWDRFETKHKLSNGTTVHVLVNATAITLDDKKYIYIAVRDITELIQTQQELEKLNKELEQKVDDAIWSMRHKDKLLFQQSKMAAMGEMLGNIAHQWRQPLNALSAIYFNVKIKHHMGKLDDDSIEEFSTKTKTILKKMNDTIDDFRNFFKPDKKRQRFDVFASLHNVLNIMEGSLLSSGIRTQVSAMEDIELFGYKNELEQVFLVVLNNSKDAIKEQKVQDGLIQIDLAQNESDILISIQDNGGGIDEMILDRVFEPYFTTKHQDVGTGIGLYMTKLIITESMQGSITIKNKNSGVLTSIVLPKRADNVTE
jgi:PAS domain S-box-containing protein